MRERAFVRVEHETHVTRMTIARPDKLNALDPDVLRDLRSALDEVASRQETRAVVLTGEGKAFVAGADIAAMRTMSREEAEHFARLGHGTFDAIEALPMPVIAAVNGFALGGGCELALACDFIYASEKAKLGQPEVKLGIVPGFGGTQRLARRVGLAMARELIYTGAMIDAEEAKRIGLVNRLCSADTLLAEAEKTARTIAEMGPLAVTAAKRVILEGEGVPLAKANALEIAAFGDLFGSADQREGMSAFLERRSPDFKAR